MHDATLISGLKQGNSDAFSKLVEQHQVPLVRLCKGFLHNEEDARDVVQEVFIEVFESIRHFREDARLSTWLYRIAVNKSLNLIRRNRLSGWFVRLDVFTPSPDGNKLPVDLPQPDEESSLESREGTRLIRKTVDSLSENQRIAFVLHKYLDLSYKEIADVMEVTVPSVESLIHRAKENLRKKLSAIYKKNLS